MSRRLGQLRLADRQRGRQPDRGGVDGVADDPALEHARVDGGCVDASLELGAEQQPGPTDGRHTGDLRHQLAEERPALACERRRVDAPHLVDHRAHGSGRDRGAAVGAAVVAGLEHRGDVAACPARTDRHPVAHRLGERDDVGRDARVLEPEPSTGATEPGLDLVDHHQRADLVAELADALEVAGRRRVHAALALQRLDQHRRHRRVDGGPHRVEIAPGDVLEALRHRLERLVLARLAGRRERSPTCVRGSCRVR